MIGRSWLGKVAITNDCDLHWDETIMISRPIQLESEVDFHLRIQLKR